MTEKEIYKAKVEGFKKINKLEHEVSDSTFLQFMNYIREAAVEYKPSTSEIEQEILEQSKIRKELNNLFQR